ncbi:MAG: C_GCAxxG_C_C family protein [Oscillospiraceae bacterium]|nr:C_GCAxxG_C_C family protein [Oscillospiraceae bacterium]
MEYGKEAVRLHCEGCNCCQAVLMSSCEQFGLTKEQAYRLAAFFGAGMRSGEVCGAVTGALMALGLRYGDENNRQCGKSQEFMRAFKQEYGSCLCRELLAKNQKKMCPTFIEYCANYLEEEFK